MNVRGCVRLETFVELDLILVTVGIPYTFVGRDLGPIVNLAHMGATLIGRDTWHISEDYTYSDQTIGN